MPCPECNIVVNIFEVENNFMLMGNIYNVCDNTEKNVPLIT